MAAQCTRKKLEYHRNYTINPKCCIKPPDLQCAGDFNPPLLGTTTDFCTEALAKGLPIQECSLIKPQKLVIAAEEPQEEFPPTHRTLKNWQKWCRIWKRNQEQLSLARRNDTKPTLMTCGESGWYKKEDKDIFERTLNVNYITGYNIKNIYRPDGCRPGQKETDIQETLMPKHYGVYPEVKRYRYAKRIRDELGLNDRCSSPKNLDAVCESNESYEEGSEMEESDQQTPKGAVGPCFNWDDQWRKSLAFLSGYWHRFEPPDANCCREPRSANLILQAPPFGLGKFGPDDGIIPANINVPELTFSLQDDKTQDELRANASYQDDGYYERRGPVLKVKGRRAQIQLRFHQPEMPEDCEGIDSLKEEFFCEELDLFSVTTRGKETRFIALKNEGTTAVRYQWLRFPPNKEIAQILANPAQSVSEGGCLKEIKQVGVRRESSTNENVYKNACLEFRFRELPGVLLPGQSLELPIVFRSQKTGYFYETLYLLTHPKLKDDEHRGYSIRLTGICMDPDLVGIEKDPFRPENVDEAVKQTTLEQESMDLMDSVLDHALFMDPRPPSSLPFMKVTSENIFYTHNSSLKYHYGTADKSLETVRSLVEMLIPKSRINNNENLCTLSIKSLYQLLWTRKTSNDFYATHFKTPNAEQLLKTLAGYNNILNEPRRFSYPSVESRKQTASYTYLLAFMDDIFSAMEHVDKLYSTPELEKVLTNEANEKYESGKLNLMDEKPKNYEAYIPQLVYDGIPSLREEIENEVENEAEKNVPIVEEVIPEKIDEEPPKLEDETPKPTPLKKDADTNEKGRKREVKHKEDKLQKVETASSKKSKKKRKSESSQPRSQSQTKDKVDNANLSAQEEEEAVVVAEEEVRDDAPKLESGDGEQDAQSKSDQPPEGTRLSTLVPVVTQEVLDAKKRRTDQAKRMIFEDLLAAGIERMICVVDALKAMEDYKQSEYATKASPAYCCQD